MTALIAARVALVIFAFIFLIAYQRRKRLFTVKMADDASLRPRIDELIGALLTENRQILAVTGFFGVLCLAFIVYTLFVPGAAA